MSNDYWWDDHDNMVRLTAWLADNNYEAKDVAYAVEKPWKYEPEFYAALYDLDESDLIEVREQFDSLDNDQPIEVLMRERSEMQAGPA
jgi:hypothetical protein